MKKTLAWFLCILMLATAVPVSAAAERVHPLGTNGAVTVGMRGGQMVYTTDGLSWKNGTVAGDAPSALWWGFWNGTEFLAFADAWEVHPNLRSKDGVNWAQVPADTKEDFSYVPRGRVDVGKYRFEMGGDSELYVMDVAAHRSFLCQDVGAAAKKREISFIDFQAYPVPGGIRVEAFPGDAAGLTLGEPYVTEYSTASLDWLLENRGSYFNDAETTDFQTGNETVRLRQTRIGWHGSCIDYAPVDNDAWTTVPNAPWNGNQYGNARLLPYNGKTFMVLDQLSLRLYVSADGVNWRSLEDTFLAHDIEQYVYHGNGVYTTIDASYKFVWTGSEYITCRRTSERQYGMMGSKGGSKYSPYCTKVCFADENFNLTGEYDFGRQVERVGYANGVYYAEVSNNESVDNRGYLDAGTVIYKSTDQTTWEATDLAEVFAALNSAG